MLREFGNTELNVGVANQETVDASFRPLPVRELTPQAGEIAGLMKVNPAVVVQVSMDRAKTERFRAKLRYDVQRELGLFIKFHTRIAPTDNPNAHHILFSFKDIRDLRSKKQ
jgi:hypothetical protein